MGTAPIPQILAALGLSRRVDLEQPPGLAILVAAASVTKYFFFQRAQLCGHKHAELEYLFKSALRSSAPFISLLSTGRPLRRRLELQVPESPRTHARALSLWCFFPGNSPSQANLKIAAILRWGAETLSAQISAPSLIGNGTSQPTPRAGNVLSNQHPRRKGGRCALAGQVG